MTYLYMRIRIFSSFCSSEQATQNYKNIWNYDPSYMVSDDSYTHVIILNTAMPNINHIPRENVVGLAFEPREYLGLNESFIKYAKKHIGRYLIGDASGLDAPFEEHYGYMWHKWVSIPPYMGERSGISMMVSDKKHLAGHKYRYQLANMILKEDLPVDIWGRGVPLLKQIFGAKTQLRDRFEESVGTLLGKYIYCIAIENTRTEAYISEKFTDCIMTDTIPVYLGARQVGDIFGNDACIHLSGILEDDMKIVRTLCMNCVPYRDLTVYRKMMCDSPKFNIFKAIETGSLFGKGT